MFIFEGSRRAYPGGGTAAQEAVDKLQQSPIIGLLDTARNPLEKVDAVTNPISVLIGRKGAVSSSQPLRRWIRCSGALRRAAPIRRCHESTCLACSPVRAKKSLFGKEVSLVASRGNH